MNGMCYDIYFAGRLLPDQDPVVVRENIRVMFRADDAQLQRLFSGDPVRIKAGVDEETAVKYRVSFREAGAVVEIRPVTGSDTGAASPGQPDSTAASADAPQGQASATVGGFELLPPFTGTLEDCAIEIEPQQIPDISHMSLSPSGTLIDESEPPKPLQIDTSQLKLEE